MASSAFKAALQRTKETKNLDTVLMGSGYLADGTYDVTIQAVDSSKYNDDPPKVGITYITADGKVYTDRGMFLLDRDGGGFSYAVRSLWSATIPDKDLLGKFLDLADTDDRVFEMLTGMKVRINLKYGPGFRVDVDGAGLFAGYDVLKNGERGDKVTGDFPTLEEAREDGIARGLQRSFLRLGKFEAIAAEANAAAFEFAYKAKTKK